MSKIMVSYRYLLLPLASVIYLILCSRLVSPATNSVMIASRGTTNMVTLPAPIGTIVLPRSIAIWSTSLSVFSLGMI